jgi:hypothetical protein
VVLFLQLQSEQQRQMISLMKETRPERIKQARRVLHSRQSLEFSQNLDSERAAMKEEQSERFQSSRKEEQSERFQSSRKESQVVLTCPLSAYEKHSPEDEESQQSGVKVGDIELQLRGLGDIELQLRGLDDEREECEVADDESGCFSSHQ